MEMSDQNDGWRIDSVFGMSVISSIPVHLPVLSNEDGVAYPCAPEMKVES